MVEGEVVRLQWGIGEFRFFCVGVLRKEGFLLTRFIVDTHHPFSKLQGLSNRFYNPVFLLFLEDDPINDKVNIMSS